MLGQSNLKYANFSVYKDNVTETTQCYSVLFPKCYRNYVIFSLKKKIQQPVF